MGESTSAAGHARAKPVAAPAALARRREGGDASRHLGGSLPHMLVLLPAVIAFLGLNVWILVTSVRSGVYLLRGGGVRTPGRIAPHVSFTVSRDVSPGMLWLLGRLQCLPRARRRLRCLLVHANAVPAGAVALQGVGDAVEVRELAWGTGR